MEKSCHSRLLLLATVHDENGNFEGAGYPRPQSLRSVFNSGVRLFAVASKQHIHLECKFFSLFYNFLYH